MIYVSHELRQRLKDRFGVSGAMELPDDSIQEIISRKLRDGTISAEQFGELIELGKSAKARAKSKLQELLADDDDDDGYQTPEQRQAELARMERQLMQKFDLPTGDSPMNDGQRLMKMAHDEHYGPDGSSGGGDIRVKGAHEAYSSRRRPAKHRKAAEHPRYDRPVLFKGQPVEELSQLETAMLGAWFRWKLAKSGHPLVLTDHDRALVGHMLEKEAFIVDDHEQPQLIKGRRVKSLLDDSSSGGEHAVPEWFDRLAITTPLLHSELLPLVTIREVDRGSSFEGVSFDNVTLTEGGDAAEGQAMDLFDTAGLVSPITGAFHPVGIALTVGLDFMEDAAVSVGETISELIGEKFAERFDFYIAAGNGTTQPEGIINASGTVDVSTGGTSEPISVNHLLDLYFGVGPNYRKRPGVRTSFGMTDTTYRRIRALQTGVTGDERLLFGMDIGSYSLFEGQGRTNVAIEQNGLTDADGFFADLSRYRFYRRRGMTLRVETGGDTLTRSNLALFFARARVGGKLVNPDAAAVADDLFTPLP